MLLGVDGRSDFDALHSRRHDAEVEFYAFDILVSDGEDLRGLPMSMRKASLSRLLARRVDGIFLSDFEQGEIGPDLFHHACLMGLEGMVRSTAALGQSQELQASRNAARYGHVLRPFSAWAQSRIIDSTAADDLENVRLRIAVPIVVDGHIESFAPCPNSIPSSSKS